MKSFLFIISLFCIVCASNAQVPIGHWQDYLSFYNVHSVEKVNDKIYAAADAGLFSYDTQDYVLQKLTRLNGLSDVEVSCIGSNSDILFIGYSNGNMDIINQESTHNIPDLFLKDMSVSKSINHVHFNNNLAYCSTDFGIVVVDILKNEIADTYFIGENATNLQINQITTTSDSIYAASVKGIYGAPLNTNSLSFYKTWKLISNDSKEYISIVSINDKLIASRKNNTSGDILQYNNGNWQQTSTESNFINIKAIGSDIAVIKRNSIILYNENIVQYDIIDKYMVDEVDLTPNFSSILIDGDKKWIGDFSNGMLLIENSGDKQIVPDGPSSNEAYKMVATENALWVVAGVNHYPVPEFHKAECSILRNNVWTKLNSNNNKFLKGAYNLNDIAIDPRNENHAYISSAHTGIFELKNDSIIEHYSYYNKNSSMELAYIWNLVNGIVMDNEGNLYANNQSDYYPIIVKPDIITNADSANNYGWYKYNYVSYETETDPWLWQTIQTSWKHFWSISFRNPTGLFVYDTNQTINTDLDDNYRYSGNSNNSGNSKFLLWDEDGKLLDLKPTCLAEDKNGYIWVGTDGGILVYYRPRDIFNIEKPIASRIKIPREDGNFVDYLLDDEKISSIAIDGANRKWIGTTSNGIYLVSSDGTKTINEFNISNSPLLSNNIKSIAINPKNGEVYIGTNKGIVSYRGTAIESKANFSSVKVFPNPVKPNYDGVITVSGLMENSDIRITDISGKVVYQAVSTGGQVVWNGKNLYNEKVSSGVYLIFASNEDGSEDMVTKIMIVK